MATNIFINSSPLGKQFSPSRLLCLLQTAIFLSHLIIHDISHTAWCLRLNPSINSILKYLKYLAETTPFSIINRERTSSHSPAGAGQEEDLPFSANYIIHGEFMLNFKSDLKSVPISQPTGKL